MRQFDLLIPSHGGINPISQLLQSLHDQTILPTRLVILVRQEKTVAELHAFSNEVHSILEGLDIDIVVLHSSYTDHDPGHGVGYDRHFLITQAQSEFTCMIDEDNVLPPGQLDLWINWNAKVVQSLGKEAIVSPTIMRRGKIQSQGIIGFTYLFPKYQFGRLKDKPWHEVKMLGANSLFGRTDIFQQIQFDPLFAGSYEDIDFSSRVVKAGYSVVVLRDCWIDHQEGRKSRLQELFLGNPNTARIRSRNRILRVRKTATLRQKIQYFGVGVWVQTFGWILYVSQHAGKQKGPIILSIFRGIRDGLLKSLK